MTTRKPTLDEWFLAYQLRKMNRDLFFNPAQLDVDVTPLVERQQSRAARISYPALVMKALALTARAVPEINRAYVRTPFGDRVVEFDHISVNLPVPVRENGHSYLTAIVVRDADRTPVTAIADQIRAAQARSIDDTKITKIVARRPNNLWWRTVLRGIHFAAHRWPGMERLGAGGLSVTSMLEHRDDPPIMHVTSFGPTAITVVVSAVRRTADGRHVMELGLGVNHVAMTGLTFRRMTTALHDVLASRDPEHLAAFD